MLIPLCSGSMSTNPDGTLACSEQWQLLPLDEVFTTFDLAQLDPELIAAFFGAGFAGVGTCFLAGFCVAYLIRSINMK